MAFRWQYLDGEGNEVSGPDEEFEDQTEAEDWLSAAWRDLADASIDQVTLIDGDDVVYGPMSLHAG